MAPNSSSTEATHSKAHAFAGTFAMLKPEMARLDGFLQTQLASFEPEIRSMANYCIDTSGKRIRPALVFLSGWSEAGGVADELIKAAAVVELVHLATLVHDDIMDGADVRRGRKTAVREFGPTPAVLLGDALFAHALHLATQFPTTEVCAAVSESTRRVCAGEIVQTLRRRSTDVTEGDYRRIIDLKTAELFRVSCFLGARLSGAEKAFVEAADSFGRHLGVAYQIYDDLADFFGREESIGKTLGTDLASGKLTLPLFALRERLSPSEQRALASEITGSSEAHPALRLQQMKDHGVFASVAAAIDAELASARAALNGVKPRAASGHLLSLCDVLTAQVALLQPPVSV
jgi:octaprenyl-diphosphate synthase